MSTLKTDTNGDMLCPLCSFPYAHIKSASTDNSTGAASWPDTFDSATVEFEGECGHAWAVTFSFSKDSTNISVNAWTVEK